MEGATFTHEFTVAAKFELADHFAIKGDHG
jgi:hypothetical protein